MDLFKTRFPNIFTVFTITTTLRSLSFNWTVFFFVLPYDEQSNDHWSRHPYRTKKHSPIQPVIQARCVRIHPTFRIFGSENPVGSKSKRVQVALNYQLIDRFYLSRVKRSNSEEHETFDDVMLDNTYVMWGGNVQVSSFSSCVMKKSNFEAEACHCAEPRKKWENWFSERCRLTSCVPCAGLNHKLFKLEKYVRSYLQGPHAFVFYL